MTTKHLSFQKERQKLINNWPEDEAERKKQIRELYEILCNECDAEVIQLELLGCSNEEIYQIGLKSSNKNIGRIVERIKNDKS